ncbi:MAG: PAS domain S-box protein [bacterium]
MRDLEFNKMFTPMNNKLKKPDIPDDMELNRKWISDLISEFRYAVEEDLDIFFRKIYGRKKQLKVITSCTCAWESWTGCDGRLIWVNSTVESMTGYSPNECISMKDYPLPLIIPEDRHRMAEVFESALRQNSANDMEFRIMKKDSSVIWTAISLEPIYDDSDKWLGLLISVRDINERKKAEEALWKERDKAQKYLDIVGVMILTLDTDQRVTLINKKGCDVLGYNEDEITGKNWFDNFLPADIKQDVKSVYNRLIAGEIEPVEYFENPVITRDGKKRTILWHNAILKDDSNQIIGVLSSGADITDRKKSEEKIIQTLLEKEMLLREIHHRVKNNLLVLYGLISFQQERLTDRGIISEILESTKQRIQAMGRVHQMLYQTKNLSEIDFSQYIRSMVEGLLNTYNVPEKSIEVAFDLDPVMLYIEAAVPCGLIVNELLVNACRHAFTNKQSGQITISLKERGDVKELCVSDNGIGLSSPLIFNEAKTLGMRLISMLTKQLKGEISYKKEKGSEFTLIFKTTHKKGV